MNTILGIARSYRLRSSICELDGTSLTITQLHVLLHIWQEPNIRTTDLARVLQVKVPTALRMLDKLKHLQLVEKISDQHDKRVSRYSLTHKGDTLLSQCKIKRQRYILQALSLLSHEEKLQLSELMQKIAHGLEKEIVWQS